MLVQSMHSEKSEMLHPIIITPSMPKRVRKKNIDLLELVIEAKVSEALVDSCSSTEEGKDDHEHTAGVPVPRSERDEFNKMWASEMIDLPKNDEFFVGMDLEGVDLGRSPGTLELLSLSVCNNHGNVFVIDIAGFLKNETGDKRIDDEYVHIKLILGDLLCHERCIVVMHDCRRDCDALWHHLGLKPHRVHDTSAAHWVLTGQENVNLNNTLASWDLPVNANRGRIDYISKPRFWEARPLTLEMINYAAGDVHNLVPMAQLQQDAAIPMLRLDKIKEKSQYYRDCLVDMDRTWVECKVDMGKFFGKGGCNIRHTERITKCFFYQSGNSDERNSGFQVYYPDKDSLMAAKRALGWI